MGKKKEISSEEKIRQMEKIVRKVPVDCIETLTRTLRVSSINNPEGFYAARNNVRYSFAVQDKRVPGSVEDLLEYIVSNSFEAKDWSNLLKILIVRGEEV